MGKFEALSLVQLGRQPMLGQAELESLYGEQHVKPLNGGALLDIAIESKSFQRMGGAVKAAAVLAVIPSRSWQDITTFLSAYLVDHFKNSGSGKLTIGASIYGINVGLSELTRFLLALKKQIRSSGRPVRIVPNNQLALTSAQVLHNKLTHSGGCELILIADGNTTILAQTKFVQDINAYAGRDQARPARDARVGMLPPKLAQIIINLALGTNNSNQTILDPFCGSGVILQEALLMDLAVIGTDIDQRMCDYASQNIKWLQQKYSFDLGKVTVSTADATKYIWPSFDAVASEVYLGRPLAKLPPQGTLQKIINDSNTITEKFLKNIAPQLKSEQRLCLAVPAWQISRNKFAHLPLLAKLTDMGYNYVKFKHVSSSDLIYFRDNQIVARQLIVLKKV